MRALGIIFLWLLLSAGWKTVFGQLPRHYFFDFHQDSMRNRMVNAAAPAAMQTFSLNNSLITDYAGNTRISLFTGMVAGKKDTMLALHSLANGAGNISIDVEWPFMCKPMRRRKKHDYWGLSINPRVSTIVSSSQTFETGMVSYDLGLNFSSRISGDLGNMSLRFIVRNAVCAGNNRFVDAAFKLNGTHFFYNSITLRLKAGPNILSFTKPTIIMAPDASTRQNLPVYVGYSLLF